MKRAKIIIPILVAIITFFASIVYSREYFLYDAEKSKILYMGEKDTVFTETMDFEKNPNLIMKTSDPNKYLAIYAPEDNSKLTDKKDKESNPGQLIIFNIATGRTEDLVELGFWPYRWNYTKDHKHFFITYKPTPDSKSMEMLHYSVEEKKSEKISIPASEVSNLSFNYDESKLYAVANRAVNSKKDEMISDLLIITYSPLTIASTMHFDQKILGLYILSQDRIALLNLDSKHKAKSLTLISTQDYSIIQEQKLKMIYSWTSWFDKEHVLIVGGFETRNILFGLVGQGEFCKVTANEIKFITPAAPWVDFEYLPEKDCLYILSQRHMEVIDFKASTRNKFDTDFNTYFDHNGNCHFYQLYRLPDSNLAAIYCSSNSEVKFYDLTANKLIKKVNCGRSGGKKILSSIFEINTKTTITTNQDSSQYYVLNRATKDITVLDKEFNKPSYIVPREELIGMYQITKPTRRTLVTTGNTVYVIKETETALEPIYNFQVETKETSLYAEEGRLILISDKELLVIDSETLKITNHISLYGDPNEKYTKLQPGARRYYFIRSL